MGNVFTQKEMLLRMMDKLDGIETKLSDTHEQVKTTNGKVKLHTKLIMSIYGALVAIAGWIVSFLVA